MARITLVVILSAIAMACSSSSSPDNAANLDAALTSDGLTDATSGEDGHRTADSDVMAAEDLGGETADVAMDLVPDLALDEWSLDAGSDILDLSPEVSAEVQDAQLDVPPACELGTPCDDGDSCTVDDQCGAQGECAGTPMDCDDGDPCTDGDACVDGECISGDDVCQCQLDEDCSAHEDGNLCNGTLVCDSESFPFTCVVDPDTVPTCEANEPEQCATWGCLPGTGECVLIATKEGESCDDNDECTTGDVCVGTTCQGTELPGICVANQPYCDDDTVCLCDSCGAACGEILAVCEAPAFECKGGECVACQPGCEGKVCGPDGCGGTCGLCPGTSQCDEGSGLCLCDCPDEDQPVCDTLTGTTYGSACKATCDGVAETVAGICGSTCFTADGATPAEEGDFIAAFFCKNLNMNHPDLGLPVSSATLKEMIWIAYFGACT